jgi:hypothetical protein
MKIPILIILILLFAGCNPEREPDGSGTLRRELFKECMLLAVKHQAAESLSTYESETSELVDSCDTQSYYLANQITTRG